MQEIENILSCSICMEVFRVPRVLPCQHTFCHECLSDYIRDVSIKGRNKNRSLVKFSCPLCRMKVEVKDEPFDASVFPLNLTVVALADSQEIRDRYFKNTNTQSVKLEPENNVRDDGDINNYSFDVLLNDDDRISWHVIHRVLSPFTTCKVFNVRTMLAAVQLLVCLVIYVYSLFMAIHYDLWLLYIVFSIKTFQNFIAATWRIKQRGKFRMILKFVIGHVVLHTFECALITLTLFSVLFLLSVQESVRTAPVRRYTVLSDLGQPQCMEEKYLNAEYVLNQAVQIMRMKFHQCVIQFHFVKGYWYSLMRDFFKLVKATVSL